MAEVEKKAPKVINKSGTLKMTDETAAGKQIRDISGKKMERRGRRDRVRADVGPKEFDEITIASALIQAKFPCINFSAIAVPSPTISISCFFMRYTCQFIIA